MRAFLQTYQGLVDTSLGAMAQTYVFFLITFAINFWIIYHGVKGGIEKFSKITMPVLFIMGIIIMVRVVTLGAPVEGKPDWSVTNGFGFSRSR